MARLWLAQLAPYDRKAMNNVPSPTPRKKFWWLLFWLSFLGTPAAVALTIFIPDFPNPIAVLLKLPVARQDFLIFGSILSGAMFSGFCLAKIFAKSTTALVIGGICCTLGVIALYVGIFFVGCLMTFSGIH